MHTKIKDISDLIKKGLTIKKTKDGLSVIKTSKKAFFENDYEDERLLEYRSVVIDQNDKIKSISFSKLFNYEELDFNKRQLYLDKDVIAVEKINGFMLCISSYIEDNEQKILFHTKGSLENEFIEWGKEYFKDTNLSDFIPGYTYIFEICHPNDPHIVQEDYGAYLIGIRSHSIDSIPMNEHLVDNEAKRLILKRPNHFRVKLSELLMSYKYFKKEGYIIREDTDVQKPLFKLKTPYYKYLKIIARGKSTNAINKAFEVSKENSILERLHEFVKFSYPIIFQNDEQARLRILKETYTSLEIAKTIKTSDSNSHINITKPKHLYLIRGLPGSGKTTLAKNLLNLSNDTMYFEADSFFLNENNEYAYNKELLHKAHQKCQNDVLNAMSKSILNVIVSNTLTTEKELFPYIEMAKVHNYKIHSIVLENRHEGESIHNVPEDTIKKMHERFSIKL